jgi:glycosyltransferase involved in cell wall biosynthesis
MARSIVHILAPAPYGGLEKVVELLSRGQAAAGSVVTVVGVFTGDPQEHPFWRQLTDGAVHKVPIVVSGRRYGRERAAVGAVLRERGADILHTHGYRPDVLHAPVARAAGVATVTTVHGFTGGGIKNRFYEWLQRRAFRQFDAVVAVSDKLRVDLAKASGSEGRVHMIQNAWGSTSPFLARAEARSRLGLPTHGLVVGWVGRLSAEKAPDAMLRAFAGLDIPSARLSMIGDGHARSELIELATSLGILSRVEFHGNVPDAGTLLRAFDALAITSHTEGTPMILFEAMAAGVPIVTTAVGGIPDVVSEREAWLTPPGDVSAIAENLRAILESDSEGTLRVDAARRRLAEFGTGPWIHRYDRVYEAAIDRARKSFRGRHAGASLGTLL